MILGLSKCKENDMDSYHRIYLRIKGHSDGDFQTALTRSGPDDDTIFTCSCVTAAKDKIGIIVIIIIIENKSHLNNNTIIIIIIRIITLKKNLHIKKVTICD